MEMNQYEQHVFEFLDNQKSEPGNRITCSQEKVFCTGF